MAHLCMGVSALFFVVFGTVAVIQGAYALMGKNERSSKKREEEDSKRAWVRELAQFIADLRSNPRRAEVDPGELPERLLALDGVAKECKRGIRFYWAGTVYRHRTTTRDEHGFLALSEESLHFVSERGEASWSVALDRLRRRSRYGRALLFEAGRESLRITPLEHVSADARFSEPQVLAHLVSIALGRSAPEELEAHGVEAEALLEANV